MWLLILMKSVLLNRVTLLLAIVVVFVAIAAPYVYWTLVGGVHNIVYFALLFAIYLFLKWRGVQIVWFWIMPLALGFSVPIVVFVQVINGEFVLVSFEHGIGNWFGKYWLNTCLLVIYYILFFTVLEYLLRVPKRRATRAFSVRSQAMDK